MEKRNHLHRSQPRRAKQKNLPPRSQTKVGAPAKNHPAGGRDPEKPGTCWAKSRKGAQKAATTARKLAHAVVGPEQTARFEMVRDRVLKHLDCLATQGAVVARWRTYRGRRLGPYYRIAYREKGRQRAIYLGPSETLAGQVRELLDTVHRSERERRALRRLTARAQSDFRRTKAQLQERLAAVGIELKGWEFRGCRRFFQSRQAMRAMLGALGEWESRAARARSNEPVASATGWRDARTATTTATLSLRSPFPWAASVVSVAGCDSHGQPIRLY